LREVLELHEPAAVMHFAGYGYVGESVEKPLIYYRNNIGGSASLLHSIIEWRAIPVIFSSTCAIYGLPEQIPITEDHPQRPINPYGHSKLAVETMLADIGKAHHLRSMSLRYFNAAGADPDGEIGEARDPEFHLIPQVLAAARNDLVVRVYGDNYDTPDGTCVRDYIHVTDLADAHVSALKYLLSGGPSCSLNLANSRGYSVLEVIELAQRVCGQRIRTETAPPRPGDPPLLIGAADRARELLNWTPRRSALDVQIQDAWNWMQATSGDPALLASAPAV
jgi:UDP-glucose-4-epimerase GalE